MPHGNKTGMDYTIRLSTKNYELRKLHEDKGDRMDYDFNVVRQKDIMTGRDRGHRRNNDFNILRQNDIMT